MTKTKTANKSFELSYCICPLGWNGKEVTFDPVQAEDEFRNLHAVGIKWWMTSEALASTFPKRKL